MKNVSRHPPASSWNWGVTRKAMPMIRSMPAKERPLVKEMRCRGIHCWIMSARGDWVDVKNKPAPTRPTKSAASTGDQLCRSAEPPTPRNSSVTILQGRNRETIRFDGMQKIRLAMSTEDPSMPWARGERSISSEMSGSSMPIMKMTLREVPTQEVREPTMAQRRSRGLSRVFCNQARAGGVYWVGTDGFISDQGRFPKRRSILLC